MRVVVKGDAFGLHLLDAPVDVALLHLEVGNAIAQQAAGLAVLLIDVNVVAGARELLGASEARRTRSDDGDFLASLAVRRLRPHPSFLEMRGR